MLQVENNKLQGEKKRIQDKLKKNSRLPPRISRRIRNSRKVVSCVLVAIAYKPFLLLVCILLYVSE